MNTLLSHYNSLLREACSGLEPEQAQVVFRALGPKRREARAQAALEAAHDWLRKSLGYTSPATARALCALEALGLYGGSPSEPGVGTTRHPAFRGLGRGRRNAADGAAWTEAIRRAADGYIELDHDDGMAVVRFRGFDDGVFDSIPLRSLIDRESVEVALWHYCQGARLDPLVIGAIARLL